MRPAAEVRSAACRARLEGKKALSSLGTLVRMAASCRELPKVDCCPLSFDEHCIVNVAQAIGARLGKSLGKGMQAAAGAIKAMGPEQIAEYERDKAITLNGQQYLEGEIKVGGLQTAFRPKSEPTTSLLSHSSRLCGLSRGDIRVFNLARMGVPQSDLQRTPLSRCCGTSRCRRAWRRTTCTRPATARC